MRKVKKLKEVIIAIFISLYFAIASTYNINDMGASNKFIFIILLAIILFPIFYLLLLKLKLYEISTNEEKITKKEIMSYFLITIVAFTFIFIVFFPGQTSVDSKNQFAQAINDKYNNWHPVIHTFLFFKIPTLVFNDYIAVVIWQLIVLSILTTIICYSFRKLGYKKKIVYILLALFLLNPINARMITVVWKDIIYSFMLLLLTILIMFITKTNGKWLNKKKNILLLGIVLFFVMAFRHNGIISFSCIIILLIFLYQNYWKKIVIMTMAVLEIFFVLTGPIYKLLNIPKHSSTFQEILGVPLNQISYIYHYNGKFSEENLEYFNQLANLETWNQNFNEKDFNAIKWAENSINKEVLNNKLNFMRFYLSLIKDNMALAIESYYHVTSPIWSLDYIAQDQYKHSIKSGNMVDNLYKLSELFKLNFNKYEQWTQEIGISNVIFSHGGNLFIIILSMAIIAVKGKFYLKKYLPFIPVLSNTLGIMLLITGKELRFVYSSILCGIPLLIYALSNISNKVEEDKEETLLHKLFIAKTNNSFLQFFRYIFVGGIAAIVNIGALFVFTDIFGIHYIISNILGFILGLITNYLLSKMFIFTNENGMNKRKEFISYAIIGIIGLGVDTLFMLICTSGLGIYYLLSKIISTIITFIWNFGARKFMYHMERKKLKLSKENL